MSGKNVDNVVEDLFETLKASSLSRQCRTCGSKVMIVKSTFFTLEPQGKAWVIPLPLCPQCDLGESAASTPTRAVC